MFGLKEFKGVVPGDAGGEFTGVLFLDPIALIALATLWNFDFIFAFMHPPFFFFLDLLRFV